MFCRVRPLLSDEVAACGSDQCPDHMTFPGDGVTLELERLGAIDPSEVRQRCNYQTITSPKLATVIS